MRIEVKKAAIFLILAIAWNGLLAWFHWAFVTGLNPFLGIITLLIFLLIAIPLSIFAVKRLPRYSKDKPVVSPATLFVLGALCFLIGNFTDQLWLGNNTFDIQLYDTYYVIAHVHLMTFFMLIFLGFAAIYFLFPRLTGRTLNAPLGYIHFGATLVTVYLLCWQFNSAHLAGMPRRYVNYSDWENIEPYGYMNVEIKIMLLLTCAQLLFLFNLIYSTFKRAKWR